MKKRLLSLLTALCLMATMVPAAFAAGTTMDETAFRNAVAQGGTVTMTGDVTLTSPLTITKGVTIDGTGNKYSINSNVANDAALIVNTTEDVELVDLVLNATETNGRGINLISSSPQLYLTGVTMNVNARGISFAQSGDATEAYIELYQTDILNSRVTGNYAENTAIGDLRGISLFDTKNCTITLNDSSIKGFGYCFNLTGTRDSNNTVPFQGTTINVLNNSDIFGWTAFNVWSSDTVFNIEDSHLRGINPSYGTSDSFATIVVNDDIYDMSDDLHADACVFNITNTLIDNFIPAEKLEQQIEEGKITVEFLFRIDSYGVTKANMEEVTFKDNTDVLPCAFIAGNGNYTQEFYDYIMGDMVAPEDEDIEFKWTTVPTSTYSDGKTELPLVIVQ